jgi:hypothetical protein
MTEVRAASDDNPRLMKNASSYKLYKVLFNMDLRRFTLLFGLYCFNPRSPREIGAADISPGEPVESVVNDLFDNCRESSTNRTFLCKTKPICRGCQKKVSPFLTKDYEEKRALRANRSKAKQSQSPAFGRTLEAVNTTTPVSFRMTVGRVVPEVLNKPNQCGMTALKHLSARSCKTRGISNRARAY